MSTQKKEVAFNEENFEKLKGILVSLHGRLRNQENIIAVIDTKNRNLIQRNGFLRAELRKMKKALKKAGIELEQEE